MSDFTCGCNIFSLLDSGLKKCQACRGLVNISWMIEYILRAFLQENMDYGWILQYIVVSSKMYYFRKGQEKKIGCTIGILT